MIAIKNGNSAAPKSQSVAKAKTMAMTPPVNPPERRFGSISLSVLGESWSQTPGSATRQSRRNI
jgi:hypothetical protein